DRIRFRLANRVESDRFGRDSLVCHAARSGDDADVASWETVQIDQQSTHAGADGVFVNNRLRRIEQWNEAPLQDHWRSSGGKIDSCGDNVRPATQNQCR